MRLASADRTGDHHVLGPLDEATARQFQDLLPGDPLQRIPVDLPQRLQVGKARFAQPARGSAGFAGADLAVEQFPQVVLEGPAVGTGLARQLPVFTPHRRQLERLQVLLDHRVCQLAHQSLPSSNAS